MNKTGKNGNRSIGEGNGKVSPWGLFDPQGEGTRKVTKVSGIKKSAGRTFYLDSPLGSTPTQDEGKGMQQV